MYFIFLVVAYWVVQTDSKKIIWDNSVDTNAIDEYQRTDELRFPNWFLIIPGTKWCGAGNIAANASDLGLHRDTDKCCRNHDLCPDIINGYDTKYNLTNPVFYTRLNCKCDDEFYKCLKSVNGIKSFEVGHIYFTVLGTRCFRYDYPIKSCIKQSFILQRKCVLYEFDTTGDKQYQWFDIPNY